MPVWHEGTAKWVKEGKLVLLGVTQEQHADRCRLLAQWKRFDWPILHDPINVLESTAVPILVAIDEHGIVRSTRPALATFQADFIDKVFADDAKGGPANRITPTLKNGTGNPDWDALRARAKQSDNTATWRELGDALALWGGDGRLEEAMDAYDRAVKLDPKDGSSLFRLGVIYRRRSETTQHRSGDFQTAIDYWGRALDLDPNQYIWRRRIQQYGPRLDKPYPFYDWVPEAETAIRTRGEQPVPLPIRPDGSEIAGPTKQFAVEKEVPKNPDPDGRVTRDTRAVSAEVVTVPNRVKPGESVRVHLVFRMKPGTKSHWNNEAEALQLWVEGANGVTISERLIRAEQPKKAVTDEERRVGFEVIIPSDATADITLPVCALYHVCDDIGGQCRFLRLDCTVELKLKK